MCLPLLFSELAIFSELTVLFLKTNNSIISVLFLMFFKMVNSAERSETTALVGPKGETFSRIIMSPLFGDVYELDTFLQKNKSVTMGIR